MNAPLTPLGPLFGPDVVYCSVNDEAGAAVQIEIYPDAANADLKDAGMEQHYYFQPQRVYVARKQDHPDEYDFGFTLFKGLMDAETTVGVDTSQASGGDVEVGGGACTFSTTFAISDDMQKQALAKLKAKDHTGASERIAHLFRWESTDPDPVLGIVPITQNAVQLAIPDSQTLSSGSKAPIVMTGQASQKGSIEAEGISSFLISCNEMAAGFLAGSLEQGVVPFTVNNTLTETFYINGVTAVVNVDVDKVYDSFSWALSTGGFLGIDSVSASAAYQNTQTTGGITTEITQNDAVLDPKVKEWIDKNVEDMRTAAMNLVKEEIFDWTPGKDDSKASTDRGWFSSIFGGSSVSVKSDYERKGVKLNQTLVFNTTTTVTQDVSGDLNDLSDALKADPKKYMAVVDVGEHFKKMSVVAKNAVNFGEKLPDGTDLRDPLSAVQIEAFYPDYGAPLNKDGTPNFIAETEGSHYLLGQPNPTGPVQAAIWTADNPKDMINFGWLRLENAPKEWPANQVKLTKKYIYDSSDPRVNLSPAICAKGEEGVVVEVTTIGAEHAPILDAAQVGYVFVRFFLEKQWRSPAITVTITPTIGGDTYQPVVLTTPDTQKNALWEVFSDKYFDATSFSYTVDVAVSGPNFTDETITWSTPSPVTVNIPQGRLKYFNPLPVMLPAAPSDKNDAINAYIKAQPS